MRGASHSSFDPDSCVISERHILRNCTHPTAPMAMADTFAQSNVKPHLPRGAVLPPIAGFLRPASPDPPKPDLLGWRREQQSWVDCRLSPTCGQRNRTRIL